jgi:SAM-dependent methyltransferase
MTGMGNDRQWWNRFWDEKARTRIGLAPGQNDSTWFGLVWSVALEYLQDLFDRRAPGKSLLECGCGSARVSRHMALNSGYECTMLDYSRQALQLAVSGFSESRLPGRFIVGDINCLCFEDGRFDIAYCGGVIEFFSDIRAPIREMTRVLKPGGVFAATIVPRKFSVQTIADWERTAAYSMNAILKRNFKEAFKRARSIPPDYAVSSAPLEDYVAACREAGLDDVVGLCATPFPSLALPRFGQKYYARLMKAMKPAWLRFNRSQGRFSKRWGVSYVVHGIKGPLKP